MGGAAREGGSYPETEAGLTVVFYRLDMAVNVNVKIDTNLWGYLGVAPLSTLEETASELGKALGVDFCNDDSGKYDEYPAYCAEGHGCQFALLGFPDEDEYLGDEPLDSFQLQIKNNESADIKSDVHLAKYFLELISEKSSLKCWVED